MQWTSMLIVRRSEAKWNSWELNLLSFGRSSSSECMKWWKLNVYSFNPGIYNYYLNHNFKRKQNSFTFVYVQAKVISRWRSYTFYRFISMCACFAILNFVWEKSFKPNNNIPQNDSILTWKATTYVLRFYAST